ncbi:bifunctional hydroxymethylpyrimidine kinase/phosphomethylpyrimidine kinase [Negadavirga shengliensis]|uniref:hydroxymethylpyrimidine kinase n=1 Tax=Negadavirga shengliensis TaxID=1389218 RepID=A0ABV9SVT0_9BACT
MKSYLTVLSIAGSDSGGGAGIQADLKTMSALGCFGTTAITAVTVQNTLGVKGIHAIPVDIIRAQIEAVMDDLRPKAIKIGMVNRPEVAEMLGETLGRWENVPVVFDPVMVASSGDRLIEEKAVSMLRKHLLPLATLITPNLDEAGIITERSIRSCGEMVEAAQRTLELGAKNVLIKGGHLAGDVLYDVLLLANGEQEQFKSRRIDTKNTHGTGCTLSTAIACGLAKGFSIKTAVDRARDYLQKALEYGKDVKTGEGHGPLNHFFQPSKQIIQ